MSLYNVPRAKTKPTERAVVLRDGVAITGEMYLTSASVLIALFQIESPESNWDLKVFTVPPLMTPEEIEIEYSKKRVAKLESEVSK